MLSRFSSRPRAAAAAALAVAVLVGGVIGAGALAGASPVNVEASGTATCTTDTSGFCTVAHDLGRVPAYVDVEPFSPLSGVTKMPIWSSAGDHTDIVNGNLHASHVTVDGNLLNGKRTGGTVVTNAFGIYDDPTGSPAGIIEDWTVSRNSIVNYATGVLCSTSAARFLNPLVVTDNAFGPATLQVYACRTPSTQSGNTVAGAPVTFP